MIGFGRTSERVRAVLALGLVAGLGATGTMAAWTDEATATSGMFSTGTVDILLGSPLADDNPTDFSTGFAMTDMAPGSSQDAVLQVNNAGTLPVTYALSSASTGTLGSALTISVYASTSGATSCTGTALASGTASSASLLTARALAAGASEYLCFRAALPASADSSVAGTSATLTLTFTATNA
ncbi:MAG: SipW-dependent-type signal peptide-containing protein [Nocardioidaceae bacterium]